MPIDLKFGVRTWGCVGWFSVHDNNNFFELPYLSIMQIFLFVHNHWDL